MAVEDLTEKFVGALFGMVPKDPETHLKLVELQRDWLIYVLDTIANVAEHGSEAFDITREAQAAIPLKIYTDALNRFLPDDEKLE